MLKTSPILTTSANASPTSFRYAPPSDLQNSKPPSAIRRRRSSRSASASASAASPADRDSMRSPARPKYSAAIDAGVQGSPMEDLHPGPSRPHQEPPSLANPPQSPCPQPMVESSLNSSQVAVDQFTQQLQQQQPSSQQPPLPQPNASDALSPTKRRSSPRPNIADSAVPDSPASKTSKRAKPDVPPPKILPQLYEFCPVEDMVELISHMLAELIATNDAIRISNGGLTRFHSRTPPGISVRDYLHRLARHATLTPPLLLAMVYYIDRLCALYQEFTINTLTVHRFLITAATVAAKGLSDSFWNNTTYARVGGVRVAELKLLELEFLYRVDWKIVPNPEVLVAYYKGLVERTPGYVLESDGSDDDDDDEDEDEEDGDSAEIGK